MSVLISVPTYETISTETYKSLWELDTGGHEAYFEAVKGYDCALARIKMCEKALEYGADWLLMVDSDTVLPHDALANMLELDADVVLGYYQWKNRDRGETCLWKYGNWTTRYMARELQGKYRLGCEGGRQRDGRGRFLLQPMPRERHRCIRGHEGRVRSRLPISARGMNHETCCILLDEGHLLRHGGRCQVACQQQRRW